MNMKAIKKSEVNIFGEKVMPRLLRLVSSLME